LPFALPFIGEDRQPAAVVLFRGGLLQPADDQVVEIVIRYGQNKIAA